MSKFDNNMFKTWQHMLNVNDGESIDCEKDKETLIREDERMTIAKKLRELNIDKEIIFKATGVKI